MTAQILQWGGVTKLDLLPESVLSKAAGASLESAVVVGWKDDDLYFASSLANSAETIFLLQRAIYRLNQMMDELTE